MSSKPFHFGLERVRELRAHDEDRAKEAFAAGLDLRVRAAAMLAAATTQLDEAHGAHRTERPPLSGHDLAATQLWLESVERARSDAERHLHQQDAVLEHRRGELTEASRRRQALDKLKERRAAEYALNAARAEGVLLDEIALNGHVRRSAA